MSSVSFGLIWSHPGVVGFILVRSVHSCAPWGSLDSLGCALRVVVFIRFCCVHLGDDWGWSCSFWYVGFVRAHPEGRRVHLGSLGSIERVLGVVRFIMVRCVRSGAP